MTLERGWRSWEEIGGLRFVRWMGWNPRYSSGHRVVERLAFSADGRLLASESVDRVLRVWDARTLQERARIPHSIV